MPDADQNRLQIKLAYSESELVFGFVYPVGTDISGVQLTLENYIRRFGYKPTPIRLSESIDKVLQRVNIDAPLSDKNEAARINTRMTAGNRLCQAAEDEAFIVSAAIANINRQRNNSETLSLQGPLPKTAHIILSLKRPEEVNLLKAIYGDGFYLIGVFISENDRLRYLTRDKNIPMKEARRLMKRDEEEDEPLGQKSRKTFEMADVFVHLRSDEYKRQLERFLDLVFGAPYNTPYPDEYAMFMAYTASLRSSQLARQVGAAIRTRFGDIVAVGCNDVPAPGGGLYWPNKSWPSDWRPRKQNDQRDHIKGYDSNDLEQTEIVKDLISRLGLEMNLSEVVVKLQKSRLMDITEYGRAVHAEMDALLTCARNGISSVGSTLFTTTFPCHICTRHIVAAGIEKVVYIEPYPKSMASKLHKDSIEMTVIHPLYEDENPSKVPFEPFVGIGPRRFFDLFSMKLSSGYPIKRKNDDGGLISWRRDKSSPRVQMLPTSYTQRERVVAAKFLTTVEKMEEKQRGIQRLTFDGEQQ